MDSSLRELLAPVIERRRRLVRWQGLAIVWISAMVLCAAAAGFERFTSVNLAGVVPFAFWGALAAVPIWWVRSGTWEPDLHRLAAQIESQHPELGDLLRTAVEQRPDAETGRLNYLQQKVIRETFYEAQKHRWIHDIPDSRLVAAHGLHALGLAGFLLVLTQLEFSTPLLTGQRPKSEVAVSVSPGDAEIEAGSTLVVTARFAKAPPDSVRLVAMTRSGHRRQVPLAKNLDDPVFGGALPDVREDLSYHLEFDGGRSPVYTVQVFEHPELVEADATLRFPEYTGLPEREIPNTLRITAVEGTEVTLQCLFNKPLASARLKPPNHEPLAMTPSPDAPERYSIRLPMTESTSYQLHLEDLAGRTNKDDLAFHVEVTPNQPPEIRLTAPPSDAEASPLEEVSFRGEITDDFGVLKSGFAFNLAGEEPHEVEWNKAVDAFEVFHVEHELALEELGASPHAALMYYLWAEDYGPDGKIRRTNGDIYFTRIRPLEEVFQESRQAGQSAASAAGGTGGGSERELLETQQQILQGTWQLIQTRDQAESESWRENLEVVRQSQEAVLNMASNPDRPGVSRNNNEAMNRAQDAMKEAVNHLEASAGSPSSLDPAFRSEQAAYQALLELQNSDDNPTRVARSQSGSGSGSGSRQRQLSELDLEQSENLYETERQAGALQSPQQQARLDILDRLRAMTQRQEDINEQLRDLESALREARSEAEREELERRLKRLREEQQEVLNNLDQARQRLARSRNAESSRAARSLDQMRESLQRAVEQLDQQDLGQAQASGARAVENFRRLQDEIRTGAASRFAEQMQNLRSQARELQSEQSRIANDMRPQDEDALKRLGERSREGDLAEALRRQESRVNELMDAVRSVGEQSENVEPLLSRQLQETYRQTNRPQLLKRLEETRNLLTRGFLPGARELESLVRSDVDALTQRIESAAEGVLGSEVEALRMARDQINDLRQEVAREFEGQDVAATDPSDSTTDPRNPASPNPMRDAPANARSEATESPRSQSESGAQSARGSASSTSNPDRQGQPQSNRGSSSRSSEDSNSSPRLAGGQGATNDGARESGGETGGWFFERGIDRDTFRGPLTGVDFRDWAERMREVEAIVPRDELRNRLAQIRDDARALRSEFLRHGKAPQWDLVTTRILRPMAELQKQIQEELLRKSSQKSLTPIDRDPVPAPYIELVKQYYENLASGEGAEASAP